MNVRTPLRLFIPALGLLLGACDVQHDLVPLPGMEEDVPEITRKETVVIETTAGEIVIDIYPEAAPNSAQRFLELVESGFYDGTPVFRIVPGFVAQFGINWRRPHSEWRERTFEEDPTLFALDRGTLAFAKSEAPNSATTQVFINFARNNRLASSNFTVFGQVVEGMEIVDSFAEVGELDQFRLWTNGERYLERIEPAPTMIERARVR